MSGNNGDSIRQHTTVMTDEGRPSEVRSDVAVPAPEKGGAKVSGARRVLQDHAQVDGHIMPLSARINGYVLEVPVIEGQLVHAGDVLVTIDPTDFEIAMHQAQATFADALASAASSRFNVPITSVTTQSNLDSAGTAVVNAQAGLKAAEQNFESAKAALEQAEANSTKTDADLVRYEKLVAKEEISRQQYDGAVAA